MEHSIKRSKKTEKESVSIENELKQTRKFQRHSNYFGFVKSRVGTPTVVRGTRFLAACCAKMVPKRCLFENPENRKGHQKLIVYTKFGTGTL